MHDFLTRVETILDPQFHAAFKSGTQSNAESSAPVLDQTPILVDGSVSGERGPHTRGKLPDNMVYGHPAPSRRNSLWQHL